MDDSLNNLIDKFSKLPSEDKFKEIINNLKENIVIFQSLCRQFGFDDELLLNKSMLNINKEHVTNDEYIVTIYAYLKTLENISGKFLDNYVDNI